MNPQPVPKASLLSPEVFDAGFYPHINPDVRNAFGAGNYEGAKSHWLTNGIYEGRMASPGFHSDYYLAVNPDLRNALGEKKYAAAVVHWLQFGLKEGRKSSPLLHSRYYLGLYPDLQQAFGPENYAAAALHFVVNGLNEARSGSPWFDPGWYLRNNPSVAEVHGATSYKAAAGHWIYSGRNEGRPGSGFAELIPFGPIQDKWEALGAALSPIGSPITPTTPLQYGEGKFNHFERGSIYWSPRTGAFMIRGGIREKWASMGWEWSFLGYPTTDELPTPDGIGRFNHFEYGSIYWTHQTGAHEVHGGIRAKWASLSWERSFLGYPVTDELPTPDGIGRFNHFQNGSIYWTDKTGRTRFTAGSEPCGRVWAGNAASWAIR